MLRGVGGIATVRPIHTLRVTRISGVCGGRVPWIWMVARIRVGWMLGIWVLRFVVCRWMWVGLDRLGGAGVGVWRIGDDRRRLHGGDLVVLETTRWTHVNTRRWRALKGSKKGATHVFRKSDVAAQLEAQQSCERTQKKL